jgi:hypothetical protein
MKPLPLSHSNLDKFKTCPKQFHEVKVLKRFKDTKGEAAVWGDYVHVEFERYLKAKGEAELPENLLQYKSYLDGILSKPGEIIVEAQLAVNTSFAECDFFAPNVFMRGYADVLRILGNKAWILDHKTGKRKADSRQMKMMALLVFALHPYIEHIRVGFAWLQDGVNDAEEFKRSDWNKLLNEFLPDIVQYRDAFCNDVWQPRQSGLCHGWCPVNDCEFWQPKRVMAKGMPKPNAYAVATSQLQKHGVLKKGSQELTPKGQTRNAMSPAERAKDRAAKESKHPASDYKYSPATNRATVKK